MGFLMENWGTIAGIITGSIALLGTIAELTPFTWDNKAIAAIRAIWSKIPLFTRDTKKMGLGNPNK